MQDNAILVWLSAYGMLVEAPSSHIDNGSAVIKTRFPLLLRGRKDSRVIQSRDPSESVVFEALSHPLLVLFRAHLAWTTSRVGWPTRVFAADSVGVVVAHDSLASRNRNARSGSFACPSFRGDFSRTEVGARWATPNAEIECPAVEFSGPLCFHPAGGSIHGQRNRIATVSTPERVAVEVSHHSPSLVCPG